MKGPEAYLAHLGTQQTKEGVASPEETAGVYKRFYELLKGSGFELASDRIDPKTGQNRGLSTVRAPFVNIKADEKQPTMRFELRTRDVELPTDRPRGSKEPLAIPDNTTLIFTVRLTKPEEQLSYKRATFYINPEKIEWGVVEYGGV